MKINNSLAKARWESLPCECGKGVINSFPIKECLHCKFEQSWLSVPQKNFTFNDDQYDKNFKLIKKQTRTVKEITLVRGERFQDVIGWNF